MTKMNRQLRIRRMKQIIRMLSTRMSRSSISWLQRNRIFPTIFFAIFLPWQNLTRVVWKVVSIMKTMMSMRIPLTRRQQLISICRAWKVSCGSQILCSILWARIARQKPDLCIRDLNMSHFFTVTILPGDDCSFTILGPTNVIKRPTKVLYQLS